MVCGLFLTSAACGDAAVSNTSTATADPDASSHVEVFVPSDGITLTQNTPTNKWGGFASAITDSLVEKGYSEDSITVVTSGSLKDQARAMADYVEDEAESETSSDEKTTRDIVILAPALTLDPAAKQFGDLLGDGTKDLSSSSDISAVLSEDEAEEQTEAEKSIAASAKTLRSRGTALILVARNLEDVTADMFVKTSNAYQIGQLQANELSTKLEVAEATTSNPRRIEIVIPEESNETISSDFFAGVWSVLGPYFKKGTVVSASGLLDSSSTKDSWRSVLVAAASADEVKQGFSSLLAKAAVNQGATDDDDEGDSDTAVRLSGVIASNDFIATQVTEVLTQKGYTGSAADINPEITLGGIVGNMTGNADLSRKKVPNPAKDKDASSSQEEGTGSGQSATKDADATRWPIVTGYGSYVNNVQLVVSGKQWLTGLENRNGLASDIASACVRYAQSKKLADPQNKQTVTLNGKKIPLITRNLVGVVSGNLKRSLVDTGYISAADAGL